MFSRTALHSSRIAGSWHADEQICSCSIAGPRDKRRAVERACCQPTVAPLWSPRIVLVRSLTLIPARLPAHISTPAARRRTPARQPQGVSWPALPWCPLALGSLATATTGRPAEKAASEAGPGRTACAADAPGGACSRRKGILPRPSRAARESLSLSCCNPPPGRLLLAPAWITARGTATRAAATTTAAPPAHTTSTPHVFNSRAERRGWPGATSPDRTSHRARRSHAGAAGLRRSARRQRSLRGRELEIRPGLPRRAGVRRRHGARGTRDPAAAQVQQATGEVLVSCVWWAAASDLPCLRRCAAGARAARAGPSLRPRMQPCAACAACVGLVWLCTGATTESRTLRRCASWGPGQHVREDWHAPESSQGAQQVAVGTQANQGSAGVLWSHRGITTGSTTGGSPRPRWFLSRTRTTRATATTFCCSWNVRRGCCRCGRAPKAQSSCKAGHPRACSSSA